MCELKGNKINTIYNGPHFSFIIWFSQHIKKNSPTLIPENDLVPIKRLNILTSLKNFTQKFYIYFVH